MHNIVNHRHDSANRLVNHMLTNHALNIVNRARDIGNRAHNIVNRAHDIVNRASLTPVPLFVCFGTNGAP